ncbi:MAG: hypothetical protein V4591_08505 [Bdellovibrionota bacterium]
MGSKKINTREESKIHKIRAALRFLIHLHKEIELAQKLEDIQDEKILSKFQEYIDSLKEEFGEEFLE